MVARTQELWPNAVLVWQTPHRAVTSLLTCRPIGFRLLHDAAASTIPTMKPDPTMSYRRAKPA